MSTATQILSDISQGASMFAQSAKKTVRRVFSIPTREQLLSQIREDYVLKTRTGLQEELRAPTGQKTTPNILETATPQERAEIIKKETEQFVIRTSDNSPGIMLPIGGLKNVGKNILSKIRWDFIKRE